MRKFCQRNLPHATGDLEWADSVTEKPKAELLLEIRGFSPYCVEKENFMKYNNYKYSYNPRSHQEIQGRYLTMTMQKEHPLKQPKHSRENVRITLNIAWPSIVESFFVAFAGLVDSLMVSSLGSYDRDRKSVV